MSKRLPYTDRPTWQRVKDVAEAAMGLRVAVEDTLASRQHWGAPEMQAMIERRLREAVERLNDATGAEVGKDAPICTSCGLRKEKCDGC